MQSVLGQLLRWDQPIVTAFVFSALQLLALTDCLVAFLPALMVLTITAHMQLLRHRRRNRAHGVMDMSTPATTRAGATENSFRDHSRRQLGEDEPYCVEYEFRDGSLRTKLTNFNAVVRCFILSRCKAMLTTAGSACCVGPNW